MFSNTAIKNNFGNNLLFTRHSQANAFSTSHHVNFFKNTDAWRQNQAYYLSPERAATSSLVEETKSETSPRPSGGKYFSKSRCLNNEQQPNTRIYGSPNYSTQLGACKHHSVSGRWCCVHHTPKNTSFKKLSV